MNLPVRTAAEQAAFPAQARNNPRGAGVPWGCALEGTRPVGSGRVYKAETPPQPLCF